MDCIYLDNAATTRCADEVLAIMAEFGSDHYGNASSPHRMGMFARQAVEKACADVANLIGCSAKELTMTSGATESNNIAILGCVRHNRDAYDVSNIRQNIVICPIDHKSSLEAANELSRRGVEVRLMKVDMAGLIDIAHLETIIDENTALVSLALVNSEIGTIQNIAAIGPVVRKSSAILHVDASQAIGKVKVNVRELDIDCLSISAHKVCGPKGIGSFYVAEAVAKRLSPLTFGGGQYRLRSGTLPSQLIVGFGVAADRINRQKFEFLWKEACTRRSLIFDTLDRYSIRYRLNSPTGSSVPQILNVSFSGVRSETIINGLPTVCVASGSACNSRDMAPSYVLTGVGYSRDRANTAIRISFLADMDPDLLRAGVERLAEKVRRLQVFTAWEKDDE